jgi:hypothetical protein
MLGQRSKTQTRKPNFSGTLKANMPSSNQAIKLSGTKREVPKKTGE